MVNEDKGKLIPLQEPTFYILLSLADGEKHGYAILKEVNALSGGRIRLSSGTLYTALSRLLADGFIERAAEAEPPPEGDATRSSPPGRRRKMYEMTQAGRLLLVAETERMRSLVRTAHLRLGHEGKLAEEAG